MKVLITGATSGIAYLTAVTLAQREHKVYLTCHTDSQVKNVKDKVKDIKNIKVMKIDITKDEDIKKVLDLNIDCLYNNASIAVGGSIIEADLKKVRENFEVNVFSTFKLVQQILKQMIEKNSGKIIIMSSIAANMPIPFAGIYSATKASVLSITKSLQKELFLIGSNVDVVLIEPGLYHTGFNNLFLDNKYDDGKYFKDIKNKLYNIEHFLLKIGERKKLDSIVIEIVRAIEDGNPKSVYRAPLFYSVLSRLYSLLKKIKSL